MKRSTVAALGGGFLILAGSLGAWAQTTTAPPEANLERLAARSREFLEEVSLGKATAAYERLLAGSPLAAETAAVAQLVERTAELEKRYGRCWNFERLAARSLGSDVVLMNYLYKTERVPLVWRLVWYRTPGAPASAGGAEAWSVVSVRFDTDWDRAID